MMGETQWYVYILLCDGGRLYTGMTNDVERRLKAHRNGTGGSFTRSFPPQELLYREECATRSDALKRELQIKGLSRAQKQSLIRGQGGTCGRKRKRSSGK